MISKQKLHEINRFFDKHFVKPAFYEMLDVCFSLYIFMFLRYPFDQKLSLKSKKRSDIVDLFFLFCIVCQRY